MRWRTSSASSSSSVGNIEDILRVIPPYDRAAFGEMLEYELQRRGELPSRFEATPLPKRHSRNLLSAAGEPCSMGGATCSRCGGDAALAPLRYPKVTWPRLSQPDGGAFF
jgi:hypothetical protein